MQQIGIYEQLINKLVASKLAELDKEQYLFYDTPIEKNEANRVITNYLSKVIGFALGQISGEDQIEKKIALANKLIFLLRDELSENDFNEDIIEVNGKLLKAVISRIEDSGINLAARVKERFPFSGLSQSELFTGNHSGISMESEIKKEIASSDEIKFLVSFIKWTGIRIFEKELRDFANSGKRIKIITTSYMGATDVKAIEFLSSLPNAQIKVSYNTQNERLHAKAYLFLRNTGFHTGYIGSSNISRSALTSGLEWNIKVTTQEVGHIIEKFEKTFDTYWEDKEFEDYDPSESKEKLSDAIRNAKVYRKEERTILFDLKPHPFQYEILERLDAERQLHNRLRNLIVAATGTGKTMISAFDFKRYQRGNPKAKLLYIAHRKEILEQALDAFKGVLRDYNFGELWVGGYEPSDHKHVFASIQTLYNRLSDSPFHPSYFDFIIIDEVHHSPAKIYRPVLDYFKPKILLGLTATPERMDGGDVLSDFCDTIAAEIRLPEALNRKLLCPFQYFGITDTVDLSKVKWQGGKYIPSELTKIYTQNDNRTRHIVDNLFKYLTDPYAVKALCFCVTQEHAKFMAEKFILNGLNSDYLISNNSDNRDELRKRFREGDINYLFVVDILNEGVDIPSIDTVLFLRPTESLTIFLQQLGRGLRLEEGKECLTVLDFVGNARPEYNFEDKFRAMVGKSDTPIIKEIEKDFPHLPLGCSIVLERKAKEYILDNIRKATSLNINQLVSKIKNFPHQSTQTLTLKNFIRFTGISIEKIYSKDSWSRLCNKADILKKLSDKNETEITRAIQKKWLATESTSYFKFILRLAKNNFQVDLNALADEEIAMARMLYYDVFQEPNVYPTIEAGILAIGFNPQFVKEVIEVMEFLLDRINHFEIEQLLPYKTPLKVNGRYTRDQILSAFGENTIDKKSRSHLKNISSNKSLRKQAE